MSASEEHDGTRSRLWPHMIWAALLSLVVPGWGGIYLGSPKDEDKRLTKISQTGNVATASVLLLILFMIFIQDYNFNVLLCAALMWFAVGLWCVANEWKWAVGHWREIRVSPAKLDAKLIYFLAQATLSVSIFVFVDKNFPIFFRAPDETPLVRAGDILYGVDFSRTYLPIERGQLLLVKSGSKTALVRVIGVPGDIIAMGSYTIHVNGRVVPIGAASSDVVSGPRAYLSRVSNSLAYPGSDWSVDEADPDAATLLSNKPTVLGTLQYMIAFDGDIIAPRQAFLPTRIISVRDVVAVPLARLGLFGGAPGSSSNLAQPQIAFGD